MYALLPLLVMQPMLGCKQVDPLDFAGIEVKAAHLEGTRMSTLAFVLGVVRGTATLVVEGEAGEFVEGPVVIRGGTVGLLSDIIITEMPLSDIEFQLPREVVTGEDLLGPYRGTSSSIVSGIGVETHHLRNEQGVEIDQAFLAFGGGAMFGFEWLSFHPGDLSIDTGDMGDTGDTGDTADTGESE